MVTRYFIYMSFKGTAYHGWQFQPNAISVQQVVENALSTILNDKISVTGAGRTDAGVHASFYCAHFDSSRNDLSENILFLGKLNGFLPSDISIYSICEVDKEMHARFSAISRTYKYYIALRKSPFQTDFSWYLRGNFDITAMNEACAILKEQKDFTSFSKLHTDVKTNNCNVMEAFWSDYGSNLIFTIKADRFLRDMVRAIVGTMVDIGSGKTSLDEFKAIIEAKNRCEAGQSVPAKGLFLVDIDYGMAKECMARSNSSMPVPPVI
ncbi:MAG TPA: tRNA pseudouridine(38-40) synthase TruA [Bacteroidetes bacterium]|nr:tRNA pseudouridine(38-40) synthase TruA [Bacteroidota bacterium]